MQRPPGFRAFILGAVENITPYPIDRLRQTRLLHHFFINHLHSSHGNDNKNGARLDLA